MDQCQVLCCTKSYFDPNLGGSKKLNNFYEENWNTQQEVLFEKESKDGWIYGFTRNYIKVKTHSDQPLKNNIVALTLSEKTPEGIYIHTHPSQL